MTSEYLLDRELGHVLAALTPANALVCRVCVSTGLRVGDALALRTDQLKPQFWITEQKTKKRRRIKVDQVMDGALDEIVDALAADHQAELLKELKEQAGQIWVFPGARDFTKHRTRQAVWADVRRAAKAFRLPQHVSPHSLRKVWAVDQLARAGGDLRAVQRAMCHSDPNVTALYTMAYQLYLMKYQNKKTRSKS